MASEEDLMQMGSIGEERLRGAECHSTCEIWAGDKDGLCGKLKAANRSGESESRDRAGPSRDIINLDL